ncbi:MAG: diguanylate cyclase [Gemmatimonadaceae bacterium]|nr:diguanylate cyclase [Gloeobacterales cyanobacterium ES-bin-141]
MSTSSHCTVLMVDDQLMIIEAVRRLLADERDIFFLYCLNPVTAVSTAIESRPTIILQDLVMPGVDGLDLVRRFRENSATEHTPIVVLSTREDPKVKGEAFAAGANDYLVKLPDKIELVARIRYHSKAYLNQLQRDEAYRALQLSQRQLAEANWALQCLAAQDGLTGIANRRFFDNFLELAWKRASEADRLSLILLDIDYFKAFNDTYGHQRGDECLKQIATALSSLVNQPTNLVARYGGEEFAVVLPDTSTSEALYIAETMRAKVESLGIGHSGSKSSPWATISLGVATITPSSKISPAALIAAADQGLYRAKRSGRNQVALFEETVESIER